MAAFGDIGSDLLTALHAGMFDEPRWSSFLNRVRAQTAAVHAGLAFRGGSGASFDVRQFSSAKTMAGFDLSHAGDLLSRRSVSWRQLRPNRVYALSELLDSADPDRARLAREIMAPAGVRYARLVRVEEPEGSEACCIVARNDTDFPASAAALLSMLAPHLGIALRMYSLVERERLRAGISADVVQRLNFGWFSLDTHGRIVDLDGQAQELLHQSRMFRRAGGNRLLSASAAADRTLGAMLREAAAGATIRARLINVSHDPWYDMLAVPVASTSVTGRNTPVLTLYVQGEEQPSAERVERLRSLFGLSTNEARLALLLSRGQNIGNAAGLLGITVESARTYSKRIYAKTGTSGQPALVRLILASVVALA